MKGCRLGGRVLGRGARHAEKRGPVLADRASVPHPGTPTHERSDADPGPGIGRDYSAPSAGFLASSAAAGLTGADSDSDSAEARHS